MNIDSYLIQQYYDPTEELCKLLSIKEWQKDSLSNAQTPKLNWKADGVDTLQWMLDRHSEKEGV
jgi:hypothetical protein